MYLLQSESFVEEEPDVELLGSENQVHRETTRCLHKLPCLIPAKMLRTNSYWATALDTLMVETPVDASVRMHAQQKNTHLIAWGTSFFSRICTSPLDPHRSNRLLERLLLSFNNVHMLCSMLSFSWANSAQ